MFMRLYSYLCRFTIIVSFTTKS